MSNVLISRQNDCRSCYKCIRNCPTKSISFQNGQASIIPDECVLCGACYLICPQECKIIRDDTAFAASLLAGPAPVYASVAPSYLASYSGTSFAAFRKTLLALGFADAEETAVGATIVKKEYDALCDDQQHDVLISTCCHSINLLIEKHYPDCAKYLAPILSPMLAHGKDLKARHPGGKVIFLGPCISKKNEIEMYPGNVDCVLTFLELDKLFEAHHLSVSKDQSPAVEKQSLARLFPLEGGILDTMAKDNPSFTYLALSGMKEAIAALEDIQKGNVHHAFIEMSSCEGSCIEGPAQRKEGRSLVSAYLEIVHSAGKEDYSVSSYTHEELSKKMPAFSVVSLTPSEEQIKSVLAALGKTSKKDELNCSSCGYASCRDKAIAVIKGKANLEMCLPFLMEKAKSFSNTIVDGSDEAILVANEDLEIQLANKAFASLFGSSDPKDFIGKPLTSFLDSDLFSLALGGTPIKNKKIYLAEEGKYLSSTISYDDHYHILIAIYRDVTSEEKRRQKQKELDTKTAEITSQVVEKNMRAVQEIASLLGESTAETKVALNNLKDALKKGEDDE